MLKDNSKTENGSIQLSGVIAEVLFINDIFTQLTKPFCA